MGSERVTWLAEQRIDGKIAVRIGRMGDDLVAEFANGEIFIANERGTRSHLERREGVRPALVEKLDTSVFDALLRHLQGKLTLHGGAVGLGSAAVAFVGPSGAGKSTLAAALCAQGDLELVADDTVAMELVGDKDCRGTVVVRSTQTAAWLLPTARAALGFDSQERGKVPVQFAPSSSASLTLVSVLALTFDCHATEPNLRRVRGHDAFALLASAAIRFVIDSPEAQLREFDQLRTLAETCPIFELRRPCQLDQLQCTVQIVRRMLADGIL
jgi:AAA domain